MCHNMFFTDFVGQYMYGGHPDAPERTQQAVLYDEGVRMGSWGLFLHSLTGEEVYGDTVFRANFTLSHTELVYKY